MPHDDPHDPRSIELQLRESLQRLTGLPADHVAILPVDDVVLMTRTLARSNYVAGADRALTAELQHRPHEPKFEPRSYHFALFLFTATVTLLALTCGLLGGIIL